METAMPRQIDLSDEQLSTFVCDGVLRLDRLLEPDRVARAREAVLRPLERIGLLRNGEWCLKDRPRPAWPATGLKPARDIGHRHPDVEALIEEPAVKEVVGLLMEGAAFDRKIYPRPLASLPNSGRWLLPGGWHTDIPRLASGRCPGVQLFIFLDSVRPRGGGTLVVAGSHRLLNDGRNLKVKEINATLRSEPFFQQLFGLRNGGEDGDALPAGRVDGARLEVLELVGEPGDVWLMDLRVLHAAAPNISERPRLMATYRFLRCDLMSEIATAFGWT
jgi:hypothetical protein